MGLFILKLKKDNKGNPLYWYDARTGKRWAGRAKQNGLLYIFGTDGSKTLLGSRNYYPSKATLDKIREYEQFRDNWYQDGSGYWTIGWGFKETPELRKNYPNGMTRKLADNLFYNQYIPLFLKSFRNAVPDFDSYNQNQLDALFDLYYNVGHDGFTTKSPKLLLYLKSRNLKMIPSLMDHGYNDPNNPGLRKRREWEWNLFNTPIKKHGGKLIPKMFQIK